MESSPVDFKDCVKALSSAFALSSKALQTELAVALLVFHSLGGPSASAKRDLRQIYADAGRPCLNHENAAYQTVMRRIGRCAALFSKIGARKVAKAVGAAAGSTAIAALVELVAPLQLRTMDEVGEYVGQVQRSRAATTKAAGQEEHNRRAMDDPDVTHVKTRHIDVAVPPGTPAKELVTLANKLLKMAEALR